MHLTAGDVSTLESAYELNYAAVLLYMKSISFTELPLCP